MTASILGHFRVGGRAHQRTGLLLVHNQGTDVFGDFNL